MVLPSASLLMPRILATDIYSCADPPALASLAPRSACSTLRLREDGMNLARFQFRAYSLLQSGSSWIKYEQLETWPRTQAGRGLWYSIIAPFSWFSPRSVRRQLLLCRLQTRRRRDKEHWLGLLLWIEWLYVPAAIRCQLCSVRAISGIL